MKSVSRWHAWVGPLGLALLGLVVGLASWVTGWRSLAELAWGLTTAAAIPLVATSLVAGLRRGKLGVDIIALLALGGALVYGQSLAGALIAVMFTSGQALEAYAGARAKAELTALLARAPRLAQRYRGTTLEAVAIDTVSVGDRLLITAGEVVGVDGIVLDRPAVIDESALTGEALPVSREVGDAVLSGSVNAGVPFDIQTTARARDSTYAGIIRLVREAEASKAPFVRVADRYAVIFLPLTLLLAGLAWALTGDPVRALAVLVVATPCPLILAAPVAIVAGLSRAAASGVIVKGGGALETLARARVLLMDKTGTLTVGTPTLSAIRTIGLMAPEKLLWLSASLEQASSHVLAAAIVAAAHARGLSLVIPSETSEEAGNGISGRVDGHGVRAGRAHWVAADPSRLEEGQPEQTGPPDEGTSSVFVAVDGKLAGSLLLSDQIRPDARSTVRALRRAGVQKVVMLTGDQPAVASRIGRALELDEVLARQTPAAKIAAVRSARAEGTTVMVGDGINDAPALAAADVGVAMGARGATASSEAADVVLLVDRLDRLAVAMRIGRRSRQIAVQSVLAGMGLSLGAMVVAALGMLPPPQGALLQEGIDVAVILNALRALGAEGDRSPSDVASGGKGEDRRLLHNPSPLPFPGHFPSHGRDDDHRDRTVVRELVANTTQEQLGETAQAAGAHDNHLSAFLLRDLHQG